MLATEKQIHTVRGHIWGGSGGLGREQKSPSVNQATWTSRHQIYPFHHTVPFLKILLVCAGVLVTACRIFSCTRTLSCGMRDLVPWTGTKPVSPVRLGVWSISHWSTREVPPLCFQEERNWKVLPPPSPLPCRPPSSASSSPAITSCLTLTWLFEKKKCSLGNGLFGTVTVEGLGGRKEPCPVGRRVKWRYSGELKERTGEAGARGGTQPSPVHQSSEWQHPVREHPAGKVACMRVHAMFRAIFLTPLRCLELMLVEWLSKWMN